MTFRLYLIFVRLCPPGRRLDGAAGLERAHGPWRVDQRSEFLIRDRDSKAARPPRQASRPHHGSTPRGPPGTERSRRSVTHPRSCLIEVDRSRGSSAGTSASSASSGTTTGYSVTATAEASWSSSPGPASNGTCRSRAGHLPMTPPWPHTGPPGGNAASRRWTDTPCACSPGKTGTVRYAGTTCSPPASHPSPPSSGNGGGCTSPGGR